MNKQRILILLGVFLLILTGCGGNGTPAANVAAPNPVITATPTATITNSPTATATATRTATPLVNCPVSSWICDSIDDPRIYDNKPENKDYRAAIKDAAEQCKAWGLKDGSAAAAGGVNWDCNEPNRKILLNSLVETYGLKLRSKALVPSNPQVSQGPTPVRTPTAKPSPTPRVKFGPCFEKSTVFDPLGDAFGARHTCEDVLLALQANGCQNCDIFAVNDLAIVYGGNIEKLYQQEKTIYENVRMAVSQTKQPVSVGTTIASPTKNGLK